MQILDRRKGIKKWLIDQGLSVTDIARAAGVSTTYASLTISGCRKSRQVLEVLAKLGCPSKYLRAQASVKRSQREA